MDHAELFRGIVETSPDAIWVLDLDGNTVYANAELARMYGIPESEVDRLTIFDTLDEDGQDQFRLHLEDVRAGRFNPSDVECQFVRRDGSTLWALVRESELRGADGSLTGNPAPDHRLQRPPPAPRRPARQRDPAERSPTDRPRGELGVGRPP